jgi:tyrosyl-tRNA synthetase
MPKVKTDKKLIDKFLNRGVENIYPSKAKLRKKMLSGERLKIYQGFDPTGPYLHVGHAIGIRALRILQQLGHEVIFLIGDYTAKIGDPDKGTTRDMLSDEQIEKNMAGWKKQAGQLINFSGKNPVHFERNHKWLSKLNFGDVLKLLSQITLQRMIERDMFERRLKDGDPIKLHELAYPLMQGYDAVAMEVDMEIGGNDQTFNMLVGRDVVKSYLGKEKFVRTNKMMDAPDGVTMSKTKGNGINLSDLADEMYGKAMSYPDKSIVSGLELLTDIPMKKVGEIQEAIKKTDNPMQYKKLLAFEIVKSIKGEKEAKKAADQFEKVFSKKETPDELPIIRVGKSKTLLDILKKCVKKEISGGELRRLVKQGAVKIEDNPIKDINQELNVSKKEIVIKVGKRKWYKIKK